jgi:hypothetical protein
MTEKQQCAERLFSTAKSRSFGGSLKRPRLPGGEKNASDLQGVEISRVTRYATRGAEPVG